MQRLFDFLARHFHWLLFLVLEVIALVMLFRSNSYQTAVWLGTSNAVVGQLMEWRSDALKFFTQSQENQALMRRNLALEARLKAMGELMATQGKDTSSVQRRQDSLMESMRLIPAQVVGNELTRSDNMMTINRGTKDGIRPDMGVVCGTGAVGVVYLCSDHYSVVLPLINRYTHLSCGIRDRGYFGYMNWQGGDPTRAWVDDVPRHARFHTGDLVETSGYSSIFPKGILVGKIEHVYNSPDGLSYRLKVHLSTDFSILRHVMVIADERVAEQQMLQMQARDSLKMNKQ